MDLCQRDPYSHNFSIKYSELDLYQRDPDSHNFSIKDLGLDLQVYQRDPDPHKIRITNPGLICIPKILGLKKTQDWIFINVIWIPF